MLNVKGILSYGIRCGIKKSGKPDLALIFSKVKATAVALFTKNKVKAAPIIISQKNIKNGKIQAVIVNSGNANACTGKKGISDALEMVNLTAKKLNINSKNVIVASTGIIGQKLPMDKIRAGIKILAKKINENGMKLAANAIMTTDTFPKHVEDSINIDNKIINIAGIAKGSGMIYPDLATMLVFIFTDANIRKNLLRKATYTAVNESFNMITVDNDTSTNDMVIVLANGLAMNKCIATEDKNYNKFLNSLKFVCLNLAKMIVKDGEGATKFIEITVKGADSFKDAKEVAMSIAKSNLVKTAIFGEDPNWGRIMAAIGNSNAKIEENKISIWLCGVKIVHKGSEVKFNENKLKKLMKNKNIPILVDICLGDNKATGWTCDLTKEYVRINSAYRT